MAVRMFWFASLLAATMTASNVFAAGPFGSIHVGVWSGGAYTNDTNGEFSHCSAAANYTNGIGVLVGQNAAGNWLLGFVRQSWTLSKGETFPIDDGQAQFRLFGTAAIPNLVTAILPGGTALEQFRKAHLMVAVTKGQTSQFNLTSTGQVLPVIANCVTKAKANGYTNLGDFSIPQGPPKQRAAVQTPAASASTKTKSVQISGTGFAISASRTAEA
jgi:hypothetical protein